MQELTIKRLLNTKFKSLYLSFLAGNQMRDSDLVKLLGISVLLLNHKDSDINRLGYRISLFYGNATGRYEPLYDIALNKGLHPVSAVIDGSLSKNKRHRDSFIGSMIGSYIDTFREDGIVLTEQQDALRTFIQAEYGNSSVVVAPTSYGKSELIIRSVRENPGKRVLILVPSKALLSQTKKRLIYAGIEGLGKVVTHPEMYSESRNNRAYVLTQERLSRLLSEHPALSFDMVFVDEAHNLLQGEARNELLASMLCILGARNPATSFKYLTPFLCDELNLRIRYMNATPKGFRIDEYIKSERFYARDFRTGSNDGKLKFYDHFVNEWIDAEKSYKDCFELIAGESLSKNIIYGNKKKSIEVFAAALAATLPPVDCPIIAKACVELQEVFDGRYRLISCLKKGVMYHHGSIPDSIRLYLEEVFAKSKHLKYLACNSTLLEGVNLPIERLFIFDYAKGAKNLTPSQFKNLIGRVNRFSEVFSSDFRLALKRLEPSIYLIGVDGFTRKRANLQEFYKKAVRVGRVDQDSVSNVLLEATKMVDEKTLERFEDAVARLENLHPGISDRQDCKYVTTEIGRLLIANSVSEIDVFTQEQDVDLKVKNLIESEGPISTSERLLDVINECFIDHLDESRGYSDLTRLAQPEARKFYAMILNWKLKKYSTKETIRLTLRYWKNLVESGRGDYVYVGGWGDTTFGESHYENWVRISSKDDVERINLAIVRLKEEDDFFEHKIFKFAEVLNGVGAIESDFYKQIKYGTADETKIRLIRDGFSRGLVDLILEKYPTMIYQDENGDVDIDPKAIKLMIDGEESDLLVFEARLNLKAN